MCNIQIGTEMHIMAHCQNEEINKIRNNLRQNLKTYNIQIENFNNTDMFTLLLTATENVMSYYFSVFLKKLFKLVKTHYI